MVLCSCYTFKWRFNFMDKYHPEYITFAYYTDQINLTVQRPGHSSFVKLKFGISAIANVNWKVWIDFRGRLCQCCAVRRLADWKVWLDFRGMLMLWHQTDLENKTPRNKTARRRKHKPTEERTIVFHQLMSRLHAHVLFYYNCAKDSFNPVLSWRSWYIAVCFTVWYHQAKS